MFFYQREIERESDQGEIERERVIGDRFRERERFREERDE